MTDAALQGGLVDEVVIVELRALRPSDLDALRRREVVEHAVQVHNGVLVEVRDHYVLPDWDRVKRKEICHRVARCLSGGGAAAFAQSIGARSLYVSASNTQRTVAVYRRFGAVVADPPDPAWFAREPLDVHLRMPLPIASA